MTNTDLTPFLDARQNQLQIEMATADAIDTKALGVLAGDIAMLIFIAQSGLSLHAWWVIGLVVAFGASLVATVYAIWPRKYAGASTNMFDHPEYLTWSTSRLVKQLISDTEVAILQNQAINEQRWRLCAAAIIVSLVASVVFFAMLYFK